MKVKTKQYSRMKQRITLKKYEKPTTDVISPDCQAELLAGTIPPETEGAQRQSYGAPIEEVWSY